MSTWPEVSHLVTRCLCPGGHLTIGQLDWHSNTLGHKMSVWGVIWPQVNLTKVVTHLAWGRNRLTFCLIGSQPASQLHLAGQAAMWKNVNLSDFGWSDSWWWEDWGPDHIGPQSRVPALQLVPLGEWPTWPRLDKWHKWALQPVIYLWHYFQGLFAVLYLHDLIIYSHTKCREMLSGLCSFQTNLLISFHHQSGILLHQDTSFSELLL